MNGKSSSIRIRLISGLLVLLLLYALSMMYYVNDIQSLNSTVSKFFRHPYTVSNSVRDINIHINSISHLMADLSRITNLEQSKNIHYEIYKNEQIIEKNFKLVYERFLGEQQDITIAYNAYKEWQTIRNEIFTAENGNNHEKIVALMERDNDYLKNLLSKTKIMTDFADKMANKFNNDSVTILQNAKQKTILLFLFTSFFIILILLWLIRSINQPLKSLVVRINSMSQKNLMKKIPEKRNILTILNYAISEIENHKNRLESMVEERTRELSEAQELLKNALNNSPISIVMINPNKEFRYVNQAFYELTGYSKQELIGLTSYDITYKDDLKISEKMIEKLLSGEKLKGSIEKRYIHKSGKIIYASVNITLLKNKNNSPKFFFIQIMDISEKKEKEQKLIILKDQLEEKIKERTKNLDEKALKLERSQKALIYLLEDVNESREKLKEINEQKEAVNQELKAFSYSVSHDLKAPLRAISGFSQVLVEDFSGQLDPEAQRYIDLINENAENMGNLISAFLEFSRTGQKQVNETRVNLNKIVERILGELNNEIREKQVEVITENLPDVQADATLIYTVFLNLISNAVKFSAKIPNPQVIIGSTIQNDKVEYFVKDNGIGLDMKYAEKIFSVFKRLHNQEEYEGTGIGLAIVQRIINKHGGKIRVESEKNKGATFSFTL